MGFFVGVRRGVSYFFFFSFGAAAHLPNRRNISLRGPSGRVQCRMANYSADGLIIFPKVAFTRTTSFFFFSASSETVCESSLFDSQAFEMTQKSCD